MFRLIVTLALPFVLFLTAPAWATKLETPRNLAVSDAGLITWSPVPNRRDYVVAIWIDGVRPYGGIATTAESHQIAAPLAYGSEYRIQVRARAAKDRKQDNSGRATVHWTPSKPTSKPNSAPDFGAGSAIREVAENAAGKVGAPVTATDADGDPLEYSLSGGDAPLFAIGSGGQITTAPGAVLDHEAAASRRVTVTATDPDGAADTIEVTVKVADVNEPPGRPAAPSVASASPTSLSVAWTAPSNAGPPIDRYYVHYRPKGGMWSNHYHPSPATSATVSGLRPGTAYNVKVQARNAEGVSRWSPFGSGTTAQDPGPPSASGTLADLSLAAGLNREVDVSGAFAGAGLSYAASSSDAGVAAASASGGAVTVSAVSAGSATVTVTASNGGGSAAQSFAVIVYESGLDADLLARVDAYLGNSASVQAFVNSLPAAHLNRTLLMTESQAGDQDFVSTEHPRAISWGGSSHEIFAWGTNPDSPLHDEVEFIFKREGGWSAGVIDFARSPPEIGRTDECQSCHTASEKPLFGNYLAWTGVNDSRSYWKKKKGEFNRLAPLGSFSAVADWDIASSLAIRHGVALLEQARAEQGEGFGDWVRELLCGSDNGKFVKGRITSAIPRNLWPHRMGPAGGATREVDASGPFGDTGVFTTGNADGDWVIAFLLINHLYETHPEVQGVYAATDNSALAPNPSEQYALFYPTGTATVEQELLGRMPLVTGLRNGEWIAYREDHARDTGKNSGKDMVLGTGHVSNGAPMVCKALPSQG